MLATMGAADAQDSYPDLRGTWTGTTDQVLFDESGASIFRSVPLTIEILEQRDRRFTGRVQVEQYDLRILGVFVDETTLRWAEPSGFAEARLTGPDSFEACFLRLAELSKIAACQTMTRQE